MKKILLSLLLMSCALFINAQDIVKCQAYQLSYKTYEYGSWSKWSEWQDVNILIVFHFDSNRINIYSSTPQEFDIYDSRQKFDAEGDEYYLLSCVDRNGVNCEIRLYANSGGAAQIYCDYANIMYVYNYYKK